VGAWPGSDSGGGGAKELRSPTHGSLYCLCRDHEHALAKSTVFVFDRFTPYSCFLFSDNIQGTWSECNTISSCLFCFHGAQAVT